MEKNYGFNAEKRIIKKISYKKKNYFFVNYSNKINIPYIIDGRLPQNNNEIAFLPRFLSLNKIKIGDKININNKQYTVSGSLYLPDYQAFIPYNSLEQSYQDSTFALVSKNTFKLIEGRESLYYSGRFTNSKDMSNQKKDIMIKEMKKDNTFDYIENSKNISSVSQVKMGIDSNSKLALMFFILFLLILLFIFYMFFKRLTFMNQQEFGCYKALGFSNIKITAIFVQFSLLISFISSIIAILAGYYGSSILVNRYINTYSFPFFEKGININSFIIGTGFLCAVLSIMTFVFFMFYLNKDTASLLNNIDNAKNHYVVKLLIDNIVNKLPEKFRLSLRVAFRKINTLILCAISILIVSTLFITSFSLYMSSSKTIEDQTMGVNYKYNINYDIYHSSDNYNDAKMDFYIKEPITVHLSNNKIINTQIVGLEINNSLFNLYNTKNEIINIEKINGIVINHSISKLYNVDVGDELEYEINNKIYRSKVRDICVNGDVGNIYLSKSKLTNQLGISNNLFSGIFTNSYINLDNADVINTEEKLNVLMNNSVSNRASGVINQIIGLLLACLLLYLIIRLNFEDSIKDIIILSTLGYTPKEVNKMLIDVYKPIFILLYVLLLPIAIYISYKLHINISIQTNDYIPFSTNIWVLLIVFITIILIYNGLLFIFRKKINKLQKDYSIVTLYRV